MRWLLLLLLPFPAQAESLIATRLIVPGTIIGSQDVALASARIDGALGTADTAIGQTARVTIYPGRPVMAADVGPAVIVKRNQTVPLRFVIGTLAIFAEGRALGAGGAGDTIRVMNLASKTTLSGQILPDGSIDVKGDTCASC